jgi:hypothetical protein
MTPRELEIVKALLDVAHEAEGRQFSESQLHAAAGLRLQQAGRLAPTLGEFEIALALIGQRGWMTRVISPTTGWKKWNLNDAGEAARLEM